MKINKVGFTVPRKTPWLVKSNLLGRTIEETEVLFQKKLVCVTIYSFTILFEKLLRYSARGKTA